MFPSRRMLRPRFLATCALLFAAAAAPAQTSAAIRPPNIVVIFADDLGYADLGVTGAKGYATPNLDRMAAEGVRLTDFYAAPSCSPSRAALLTGCYPQRVGIPNVLFPNDRIGLNPDETIIPELLKTKGYATACIGKWHLGHLRPFLPPNHGFDLYFGLPYSNDMSPNLQHNPNPGRVYPPLPLIRGTETIEEEPDQSQLTTRYTEEAVKFIKAHDDEPFFLYLPHSMPHVPIYVSDKFKGKTQRGLYGDVIQELDWSVGQILDAIKEAGLDEDTLVIFTSDNGPWAVMKDRAGSAGPLRGSKGGTFEGGMREPFIARWPGRIKPGAVCKQPAATMDFLPTFARLAEIDLPADGRRIDGKDIWPLLSGDPDAKSPHDAIYFYTGKSLRAVRSGQWKLHVSHPGEKQLLPKPELYNLESDIGETTDVAAQHPDVVQRLTKLIDHARTDLGDALTNTPATGTRPPGQVSATE